MIKQVDTTPKIVNLIVVTLESAADSILFSHESCAQCDYTIKPGVVLFLGAPIRSILV
jgi:hypothetical protein